MCIGIPMRVIAAADGWADCEGRGERRRVRTALVGEPQAGDQLLVFIDSAIERLPPGRAAEIDAALDLLQAAMHGEGTNADPGFALPSRMDSDQLAVLTGTPQAVTRSGP
ncbi:HypC/HybG/HupF family hydrogenase formation chaperone [Sinimarinibacterium flocculans]|uniref:Hydrogenase expression/formation protein HypC n=1 Tax=Sinimarinibacterium flocculans TaxID=985250 RepID=A0A318E3D0_9GAMM|nr:HypC/HybG/HupF family hydrogenase formation chaperone [Sinimarinibacterium flocculans]PXV65658.1 hydrogenase expression/formation protein HypC [Sinimarinibacterium flocculans]